MPSLSRRLLPATLALAISLILFGNAAPADDLKPSETGARYNITPTITPAASEADKLRRFVDENSRRYLINRTLLRLENAGQRRISDNFRIYSSLLWTENNDFQGAATAVVPLREHDGVGHITFLQPAVIAWNGADIAGRADSRLDWSLGVVHRGRITNDAVIGASFFLDGGRYGHRRLGAGIDYQMFHTKLAGNYYHPLSASESGFAGRREHALRGFDLSVEQGIAAGFTASLAAGIWETSGAGAERLGDARNTLKSDIRYRLSDAVSLRGGYEWSDDDINTDDGYNFGIDFKFPADSENSRAFTADPWTPVRREARILVARATEAWPSAHFRGVAPALPRVRLTVDGAEVFGPVARPASGVKRALAQIFIPGDNPPAVRYAIDWNAGAARDNLDFNNIAVIDANGAGLLDDDGCALVPAGAAEFAVGFDIVALSPAPVRDIRVVLTPVESGASCAAAASGGVSAALARVDDPRRGAFSFSLTLDRSGDAADDFAAYVALQGWDGARFLASSANDRRLTATAAAVYRVYVSGTDTTDASGASLPSWPPALSGQTVAAAVTFRSDADPADKFGDAYRVETTAAAPLRSADDSEARYEIRLTESAPFADFSVSLRDGALYRAVPSSVMLRVQGLPAAGVIPGTGAGARRLARLTLVPPATVGFASDAPARAGEGDGVIRIPVEVSHLPAVATTFTPTATGTATAADYTLIKGSVTFAPDDDERAQYLELRLTDDAVAESAETVVLTLAAAGGYAVAQSAAALTLTIDDNEGAPTLSVAGVSATEGGDATLTVRLSAPTDAPVSGVFSTTDGTAKSAGAAPHADYTPARDESFVIPAGATETTITVPLAEDHWFEPRETFTVTIVSRTPGVLVAGGDAVVTIADDDTPTVQFAASDSPAKTFVETDADADMPLMLESTKHFGDASSVNVAVRPTSDSADFDASAGADFAAVTSASLAAEGLTHFFSKQVKGDDIVEPQETFEVVVYPVGDANYVLGERTTTTVTIQDDDTAALTVTATPLAPAEDPQATLETGGGGGSDGRSFMITGRLNKSVQIPRGDGATLAFSDADTPAAPALIFEDRNGDGVLADRELEASARYILDSAGGFRLAYALDEDSAHGLAPAKFTGGGLSVADVVTPTARAGDISAIDDNDGDNGDNNGAGNGDNNGAGNGNNNGDNNGGNNNDDNAAVVKDTAAKDVVDSNAILLSVSSPVTVSESDGAAMLTVSLSPAATVDINGVFSTANDTAVAGADYTAVTDKKFTIAAGESEAKVEVAVINDNALELDESFDVVAAVNGSSLTATVVVTDDDPASARLSVKDANGNAISELSEAAAADAPLTVSVSLSDNLPAGSAPVDVVISATAPAGVSPIASQTLTFAATEGTDEISATLTLPSDISNSLNDDTRAVVITATPIVPPSLSNKILTTAPSQSIRILDDDPVISFTVSPLTLAEGDTFTVTVATVKPVNSALSVPMTFGGGESSPVADIDIVGGLSDRVIVVPKGANEGALTVAVADDNFVENAESLILDFASLSSSRAAKKAGALPQSVTITDNDTAGISVSDVSVSEDDGTATITVSLDTAAAVDVAGTFTTTDGTATVLDNDYTAAENVPFTIPAGQTSAAIAVALNDDELFEPSETFTVTITSTTPQVSVSAATAVVTINEDDPAPVLTVNRETLNVSEDGAAQIEFTLDRPSSRPVNIRYNVAAALTNTAQSSDIAGGFTDGAVVVPANDTRGVISVSLIDDEIVEPDEHFVVSLVSDSLYTLGSAATVAVTLSDNDNDTLIVSAPSSVVGKTFDISGELNIAVQVPAGAAITFTDSAAPDLVFTDSDGDGLISESELAAVVRYSHAAAEKLNLNYTFTPAHRLKSSQFINGQTQVTIAAPSMSVPASVTVNENAGAVSVAVSLDTVAAVDIPGTFSTTDGAATAGSDYTAAVNSPFTIKAGQTAATLSVSVTDDSALEENENFTVTVKSDSSLVSVVNDTATVNIRDDDSLSTLLTLKDGAAAVSEIGEADAPGKEITAEIALSETLPAGDPLVVAVSVALPAGVSPVADQRVSFSAGEGKSPKSVAFTLPDDIDNTRNDGTRAVVITATPTGIPAARGATVAGTPATARISILDDDPEITFTVSDNEVAEGESFIVTVISSKPVNRALAVPLALRAGRALVSQDIVGGLFGKSAVIPKGMTEGTTTIAVANDNEVEDHETVTVDFASLIGTGIARKWLTNPQTVTIIDSDTAALAVSDITVPENVLGGKAALTVSLLGAVAGRDITGAFSTADGTATAPDDYTAAVNAPFTIVAGQKSVAVAVDIIDEGILEPSENFTVSIASTTPRVTTPAATATATVTVTEADSALLSIADASAAENAGAVSVALSLAAPAGIDITGVFSTSDRTATAPDDYTAAVNAPFTIKAGQTSAAVTVAVIDDNLHETAETFNIKIKPAHPGVVTAEDTATVTVTDNDTPPVISFLFGTASGDENENAELALLMNKPVAADVAVSVAASASAPANARFPADEGADYTIHHEFIIRPADGITPTLAVPVIDDNIVEAPETFTVTLRPARGYTLGARTALAYTVRDNDITALGDFTTSPARPAVGDTFTISASLSNPLQYYQGPDGQPVYFFEPNTAGLAFADTDYDGYIHGDELTTTSIMPVRAGGTLVYKNKFYVAPKTPGKFSVAFSATTGHSVRNTGYSDSQFKNATFSRNITDKTALSIPSGRQRISVGEGAGAAEVVIQINPALGQNAAASLVIKNDSDAGTVDASPREDYSRFSFNVKLSADAASVATEIPIISDDIVEADETMQVRLVASPGAPYIVAPNSIGDTRHANALITITDDDTAELALAVAPANPITDREFTLTATLGKSVQVARKGSLVFTNTAGAPPLVFVDLNANGRISGAERTVSVRHTHKTAETLSLDYALTPKYGLTSDKFTGGALSVDILAPAVVQFVAGDAVKSVPESDSRGVISLTVESDRALGVNTLVPAAVSNAATSRRIGDTVADIAPTGTRHPFSIAVVGDTIVEPDKVYNITLFPLDDAPYVLGARKVARVTIADDDTAALSLVTLPESPVAGRDFTVAATLSRSVRVPFGGSLTFTDGGGAPDLVFIDRNSDALISGGELSVSVNHTHDDAGVVSLDYDFVPQHGLRADKFSGGTFDIAVVPKPVLQFVAADETKSIIEGDNPQGSLRLFIEADKDVGVATEIVAVISGAGGRIGSDRVTVTPVGTRFRFSFLFRGNDSVEPDKTFTVALVAVDDAPYSIGGRGVATVNVADDDTVTVGNFVVNPAAPVAGSPFTVSATLTAPVQYSGSAPLIFYEGGGKQRAFKFRDGDGDGFIRGDEMTTFVEDAAGATHSYSVNGAGTYLLRFSRPVIADGAYDSGSGLKDAQFTDPEILTIRISNPGTQ